MMLFFKEFKMILSIIYGIRKFKFENSGHQDSDQKVPHLWSLSPTFTHSFTNWSTSLYPNIKIQKFRSRYNYINVPGIRDQGLFKRE